MDAAVVIQRTLTDHERFEKYQSSVLKDDPATVAFYNAQIRTQQRVSLHNSYRFNCGEGI